MTDFKLDDGSTLAALHLALLDPARHASAVLPGPFVVMQGSPGDGMSNTLDGLPHPPSSSLRGAAPAAGNEGVGGARSHGELEGLDGDGEARDATATAEEATPTSQPAPSLAPEAHHGGTPTHG